MFVLQLSWLQTCFQNSAAIGLLRSSHAPFLLHFFQSQFKPTDKQSGAANFVRHQDLLLHLANYLDDLHQTHPDAMIGKPENYISDWSGSEKRYLRRFLDADVDEPLYELTSSTEAVLTFLQTMARRETQFVGTESRLKRIIETLSDLAIGASEDVETRVEHLRKQRDALNDQIDALQSGGDVQTYHQTAIRERFAEATEDLMQLQGDFRAVEERFKEITREVQKRQVTSAATRGEILGEALDAEDTLKTEDQGVSFNEFARLILSPAKQEQLEAVIREVIQLESIGADQQGIQCIRDMVPALTGEARKVLRTLSRLSSTLRRLLDRDSRSSRQRLAEVLGEIRAVAVQIADAPDRRALPVIEIDTGIKFALPLERPVWSPPTVFQPIEMCDAKPDDDERLVAFSDLAMMKSLNWNELRNRIHDSLESSPSVRLHEVLDADNEHDAVDVMGLIQIAHEDDQTINDDIKHTITVRLQDESTVQLEVPEVIYERK